MRPSRTQILSDSSGLVHKYWRCHNREFLLENNADKELYLEATLRGLNNKSNKNVHLHAFCIMDNHAHQCISFKEEPSDLSNYMRYTHGLFGLKYNKTHNRTGKVANERPKTSAIENDDHALRVHMYIEANPIRARKNKFENLHLNKYCSYRFFAHGIIDQFTKKITLPNWYTELGKTMRERQKAYRLLFEKYLKANKIKNYFYSKYFIGTIDWVSKKEKQLLNAGKKSPFKKILKSSDPPQIF